MSMLMKLLFDELYKQGNSKRSSGMYSQKRTDRPAGFKSDCYVL